MKDGIRNEYPKKVDVSSKDDLPEELNFPCPRQSCTRCESLKRGTKAAPFDYSCVLCGFSVDIKERDGELFAEVSDTYD